MLSSDKCRRVGVSVLCSLYPISFFKPASPASVMDGTLLRSVGSSPIRQGRRSPCGWHPPVEAAHCPAASRGTSASPRDGKEAGSSPSAGRTEASSQQRETLGGTWFLQRDEFPSFTLLLSCPAAREHRRRGLQVVCLASRHRDRRVPILPSVPVAVGDTVRWLWGCFFISPGGEEWWWSLVSASRARSELGLAVRV